MNKLNFGCGARIADGWMNIDFHASDGRVKRVNLLAGFPFPDHSFDVVYSSHVLEHFTMEQAIALLRESRRVLRPGGVLRAVVPDLEASTREYHRILDLADSDPAKAKLYEWVTIELLDQLVRSSSSGAMGDFVRSASTSGDAQMLAYIRSRTESAGWPSGTGLHRKSFGQKLKGLTWEQFSTRLTYIYLACVKRLIPGQIRPMVIDSTGIGEKHRWMYDRYGFGRLMKLAGFPDVTFTAFDESSIPGFADDHLDSNADGTPYKNASIYCEARRDAKPVSRLAPHWAKVH
jgi:Methyltransferase domain